MADNKLAYPNNIIVQGTMAFPIKSEEEIVALKEWREGKGIKKPKYPDRIGGNLLIKEKTLERIANYLESTYIPFIDDLRAAKKSDMEPEDQQMLLDLVKARDWSDKNLPIRELTPKDIESNGGDDCPFAAKIKFQGPYKKSLPVKYVVQDENGKQQVVEFNELGDYGVELPKGSDDPDKLWFGSGWPFRVSFHMNAYNQNDPGITAYANEIYLLTYMDLPVFTSNNDDAVVAEDGDDWSDE